MKPIDIVQGNWKPGDGGFYDRVSALRHAIRSSGGIGRRGETKAVKLRRAAAIERVFISFARQDPNDFVAYVFRNSEDGSEVRQALMHYRMQQAFHSGQNVAIEAYRGSGKTTQLEAAILWTIGKNPNILIKLVSESAGTASQRVRNIRNNIEGNRRLRYVFPDMLPQPGMPWSDESITVKRSIITRDPTLGGWGITSKGVGGRCNLLCGDDAIPPESMTSQAARDEAIRMWQDVWSKQLFKTGRIWFVFTPWHELDLGAKIRSNPRFLHEYFAVGGPSGCKACPDHNGEPCGVPFHNPWAPHLWPSSALQMVFERDGSLSYSRSHMLVPLASDLSLFPDSLFENGVFRSDLVMGIGWRWWQAHGVTRVMGVDLALGAGGGADYFVAYVLGFDKLGYRYTIDYYRTNTADYQGQLELVSKAYARYRPDLIFVEGVQYQRVFTQLLAATTALPVMPFYPLGKGTARKVEGAAKRDLRFGVPSLRLYFENNKWYIPTGDADSREKADYFVDELKHFAMTADDKVEGVGAHDDIVMAAWIADHAARKLGAGFGYALEDVDEDLRGIEDHIDEIAKDGLHRNPNLGGAVADMITSNDATSKSVPAPTIDPKAYNEIREGLSSIDPAVLESFVRFFDNNQSKDFDTTLFIRSGFSVKDSRIVGGLLLKYGRYLVDAVIEDVTNEITMANVAIDTERLARMDEDEYSSIFGDLDY